MIINTAFGGVGSVNAGKVDGVGTIQGGVYGELDINGVCTVEGDLKAESISINGVCTCNGNVETKKFDCDGVLTINGNLRAGTADIDGVVTVNGNKIEADRIDCDGVLSVEGEISADVIDADGKLNAKEIVGDRIRIKSYWSRTGASAILSRASRCGSATSSISAPASAILEGSTLTPRYCVWANTFASV